MTHTTASHPHVARYRFVQMLRMYYPNASREEIRTWCGWVKPKEQEEGRPTFTPAQVGRRESTFPPLYHLIRHQSSPPVSTMHVSAPKWHGSLLRTTRTTPAAFPSLSCKLPLGQLKGCASTAHQRLRLSRAHPATLETAFLCATGGRAGSHLCIGGL